MRRIHTLAGLLLVCASTSATEPCATLDACVLELREMAHADGYMDARMDRGQSEIGARIRSFEGGDAALVTLLADPDIHVASMASKGLRDGNPVDSEWLPRLVAGAQRGLGWIAPAIGRIPTDQAARATIALLLTSDSAPHNQEGYAARLAGARVVPHIVEAAKCRLGCDEDDAFSLQYVLEELGAAGAGAAPGLMDVAMDPSTSDEGVQVALFALSGLKEHARSLELRLIQLREQRPALGERVDETLIAIGASQTSEIILQRLRAGGEPLDILVDIARAGPAAGGTGPAVIELLHHADPKVRVEAARALVAIAPGDGAAALIPLLDDVRDVRINWVAADGLGRLGAEEAVPALERTAASHWYPPVRKAANRALDAIRKGTVYDTAVYGGLEDFDVDFISPGNDLPRCETDKLDVEFANPGPRRKLEGKHDAAALQDLTYISTVVSYGLAEEPPPPPPGQTPDVIQLTPGNMVRKEELVQQAPSVAVRVDGGWLVGSDRGEWGGELVFVGDDGLRQTILEENVQGLDHLGERVVAAVGIAHLSINEGHLLDVRRAADGNWVATPWRGLPGAPWHTGTTTAGELVVQTNDGDLLVSADGTMRMAPCQQN